MDKKVILVVSYIVMILGIGLFVYIIKSRKNIFPFFKSFRLFYRVSVILGLLLFLPFSLLVAYFEMWLGGAASCELGELLSYLLDGKIGILFKRLLCSVGASIGTIIGFFAGFVFLEVLGAALIVLIVFLILELWSRIKDIKSAHDS